MIVTKSIADKVKSMPMLSAVSTRLLELLGDENHSIPDVVKIVENDAVMTSKILRVANSAALAPRVPVTSVITAINNMGEKMILGIAIESCSGKVFKNALDGYDSKAGELWDHSLCTAIASRLLASHTKNETSSNLAFTAGLLHDIGKSIISEFLTGNTADMVSQFDEGRTDSFLTAEKKVTGFDHAELGYELAQHWKLPEPLANTIRFHHNPADVDENYRDLVYTVHLGDIVAMMAGIGTGVDCLSYKIDPGYNNYFDIGEDELAIVVVDVQDEFAKTKAAILGGSETS